MIRLVCEIAAHIVKKRGLKSYSAGRPIRFFHVIPATGSFDFTGAAEVVTLPCRMGTSFTVRRIFYAGGTKKGRVPKTRPRSSQPRDLTE
jgi:hypothetical protein